MHEQLLPITLTLLMCLAVLVFSSSLAVAILGRRFSIRLLLVATTAACIAFALAGLINRY